MRRTWLVTLLLALLPSLAFAQGVFRCTKGEDVRFEQAKINGYKCTRLQLAPAAMASLNVDPVKAVPASAAVPTPQGRKGAIYKRIINGVPVFSSRPSGGATVVARYVLPCFACRAGRQVDFGKIPLNSKDYAPDIQALSRQHGVDAAWVRAIVHAESNFNPRAISPKGAQGLMQLMPATARRFGVAAPFDAVQNLAGGVKYLAWLLRRFKGNHALATAAYNAGEGAVERYQGVPPYRETRLYVQRVTALRSRYAAL